MKGVIDGLISAFQAHTRFDCPAGGLGTPRGIPSGAPDESGRHLIDPRRSVLGAVDRLVYPYQSGAKWNPSDHLCVAGELIRVDPPSERHWEIGGNRRTLTSGAENSNGPKTAVIVDMDGTLCDVSTVVHLQAEPDGFTAFHHACAQCPPNEAVVEWCVEQHGRGHAI